MHSTLTCKGGKSVCRELIWLLPGWLCRHTSLAALGIAGGEGGDQRRILYATFTARVGHQAEVSELIAGLQEKVRQEPGNLVFQATTRQGSPREFVVYEEYVDEDAFQAHINADYGAVFVRRSTPSSRQSGPQHLIIVCVGLVATVECQAEHPY